MDIDAMDFLGNTDKQTNKSEIWHDHTITFSRWKSYLKICIWSFNFLIIKKSVVRVILNGSVRINGSRYKFKYIRYVQAL